MIEVLRRAGRPLTVGEIVMWAGDRLPTRSKSPRNVVARDLCRDLKKNPDTQIVRTGPGTYALKEFANGPNDPASPAGTR